MSIRQVSIMDAKDIAANSGALAIESSELKEAVRMVLKDIESEHANASRDSERRSGERRNTMSQVFDKVFMF